MADQKRRVTVTDFRKMKQAGKKICMLTAYDFPTARWLEHAGVDCLLVGDSLGMVVQGRESTLPVTLDEIIYHAEMVGRAVERCFVVVDMPFLTYQVGQDEVVKNAGRILKETTCQAVKLEAGKEQAATIARLVSAGIPVMAHVGLRPQSVHQTGGYKIQRNEDLLLHNAHAAADAGAFSMVLECVPSSIAARITREVSIPTIGIGAGPSCDGQVLVTHDMLGLTHGYVPSFVKKYAALDEVVCQAVESYCDDVRQGRFPDEKNSFK